MRRRQQAYRTLAGVCLFLAVTMFISPFVSWLLVQWLGFGLAGAALPVAALALVFEYLDGREQRRQTTNRG